jgi:hypothetical protein
MIKNPSDSPERRKWMPGLCRIWDAAENGVATMEFGDFFGN